MQGRCGETQPPGGGRPNETGARNHPSPPLTVDVQTAIFKTGALYPHGEQSCGVKGGRGAGQGSTQLIHCFLKSDQVVCEGTAACVRHHLRDGNSKLSSFTGIQVSPIVRFFRGTVIRIPSWDSDQDHFVRAITTSSWDSDQDHFVRAITTSLWDSDQDHFVRAITTSLWDRDNQGPLGDRAVIKILGQ